MLEITVGRGALIVTVALPVAGVVHEAPVQVAVNVVLAVRTPEEILVPVVPVRQAEPALVTLQAVVLVEVHEMLDVPPEVMEVGLAVILTVGLTKEALNVAVTEVLEFTVTVQVPVPVQAPDQPPKVELESSITALRVAIVPAGTIALHDLVVELHEVKAGLEEMFPLPVPVIKAVMV